MNGNGTPFAVLLVSTWGNCYHVRVRQKREAKYCCSVHLDCTLAMFHGRDYARVHYWRNASWRQCSMCSPQCSYYWVSWKDRKSPRFHVEKILVRKQLWQTIHLTFFGFCLQNIDMTLATKWSNLWLLIGGFPIVIILCSIPICKNHYLRDLLDPRTDESLKPWIISEHLFLHHNK
jgi:hypothetical protein